MQNSRDNKILYRAIGVVIRRIFGIEVPKTKMRWLYVKYRLSRAALSFLEKLTKRFGTDQGVVAVGAFLLFMGYLFQIIALFI